ncbi:MAG: hypothetical protein K0R62_8056 [Nonomuraea muscovyensis]|nr:hypothetical protein [Nonomuraea muscovyensis]
MFGRGLAAVIALVGATAGTCFEILLVARARAHCLGDLSAGEQFAGTVWVVSRIVAFPVVSGLSALFALSFPLVARLPWLAGRSWPGLVLPAIMVAAALTGPVAMTLYDLATEGTPGGCVLPWWPSWLPS